MDTPETRDIILRIDRAVTWNRRIFLVTAAITAALCFATGYILFSVKAAAEVGVKAYQLAQKNDARIDAQEAQLIIYMKLTTQYWDKLSKDNPKIRVPRPVETTPADLTPAPKTDAELTRPRPAAPPNKSATHKSTPPKPAGLWDRIFNAR